MRNQARSYIPKTDGAMRRAFASRGLPLWVPPSEVYHYLACNAWSEKICLELHEWFARMWSMAFAAGYRLRTPLVIAREDVFRQLSKMGYSPARADELADMLVMGLPGLYKKGLSRAGTRI